MQLLVITIDDCDEFLATLEGLRAHGMNGIVFQSTSLKHALLNSNVDAPPIFGRVSKKMSTIRTAKYTRKDRTAVGHEIEIRYIAGIMV